MKANELMVGNWVLWKGKPVQVARVSGVVYEFGHIDVTLAHCNDNGILESHDIKSISPIPLTDEILEKNGFKNIKESIDGECESFSNLFELNEDVVLGKLEDLYEVCCEKWNGDWDVYEHHPVFAIRHLHQLQNVLNIMGFGKEIDL